MGQPHITGRSAAHVVTSQALGLSPEHWAPPGHPSFPGLGGCRRSEEGGAKSCSPSSLGGPGLAGTPGGSGITKDRAGSLRAAADALGDFRQVPAPLAGSGSSSVQGEAGPGPLEGLPALSARTVFSLCVGW